MIAFKKLFLKGFFLKILNNRISKIGKLGQFSFKKSFKNWFGNFF
jgi:hypothetical protein